MAQVSPTVTLKQIWSSTAAVLDKSLGDISTRYPSLRDKRIAAAITYYNLGFLSNTDERVIVADPRFVKVMKLTDNLNEGLAWIRRVTHERLPKQIKLGYMKISSGVWDPGYDSYDNKVDLDPDEIIDSKSDITIVYDYPLAREFRFTYRSDNPLGFTRKKLSELIMKQYHQIYTEKESEVVNLDNISSLSNREKSHGKYGIWGYKIDDLTLHTLYQNPDGIYYLGIDN